MHKFRLIGRIDINNSNVVKGKCLEGLRKIGNPEELACKYYQSGIDELVFMDAVASLYDRNSLIKILKETKGTCDNLCIVAKDTKKLKEKSYTPVCCDIDKHGVKGDE